MEYKIHGETKLKEFQLI